MKIKIDSVVNFFNDDCFNDCSIKHIILIDERDVESISEITLDENPVNLDNNDELENIISIIIDTKNALYDNVEKCCDMDFGPVQFLVDSLIEYCKSVKEEVTEIYGNAIDAIKGRISENMNRNRKFNHIKEYPFVAEFMQKHAFEPEFEIMNASQMRTLLNMYTQWILTEK